MKETELAKNIVKWLKAERPYWKVYQEIKPDIFDAGVADIVCIRAIPRTDSEFLDRFVWVIEVKTSLSLKVIQQAYQWNVDYRSVAVPSVKSRSAREDRSWWYSRLKHELGIGTIEYNKRSDTVKEQRVPVLNDLKYKDMKRHSHKHRLIELAKIAEGYANAGSKSGGYWTPYKESISKVKGFLKEHPGSTSREIIDELGPLHYSSKDSARSAITQSLQKFENDWCRTQRNGKKYRFYVKENQE